MAEKNLEKNVNEQSDADQIWSASGIIVHKNKLNLVSIRATDLILDVPAWALDLALGQERLANAASTPDLKRMFDMNAKILRNWAEGDDEYRGLKTRKLATAEPYLAARAALGYHEVHPWNFQDFVDDVMRRATPAIKGDTLAFVFVANPEAPEIYSIQSTDYLVRYAMPGFPAQILSHLDFSDLCLAAIRKFPVPVADNTDSKHLTPEDIFNQAFFQGLLSGIMPAGIQMETSAEQTKKTKPSTKQRIPKKRQ